MNLSRLPKIGETVLICGREYIIEALRFYDDVNVVAYYRTPAGKLEPAFIARFADGSYNQEAMIVGAES